MIRVLLVDDQSLFRTAIRVILEAHDEIAVVGEAADGSEAVELAAQLDPDVVLMDLRMPEMDGVEATRQILDPAKNPRTKVLVLTTFNLDDRAATAIRYGASGFLLKDITPSALVDAVRTVHLGNAVISPRDLTTLIDGSFAKTSDVPDGYDDLTEREKEVLRLVAKGLSNAEIGSQIYASESTVKAHVGSILRKLGLRDRVQVVVTAYEHGLV